MTGRIFVFYGDKMNYASFSRRFLAFVIDIIATVSIFWVFLSCIPNESFYMPETYLGIPLLFFIINFIYFAALESSKYQATIGKMFMSVKVVNSSGEKISRSASFIRAFLKCLSFLCPFVFIICAFTAKKQNLHDLATRSFTINENESSPKTEKSLRIAVIIITAGLMLSVLTVIGVISLLVHSGFDLYRMIAAQAVQNKEDITELYLPQRKYEDISISIAAPFMLSRNAEKEDAAAGISEMVCYGEYSSNPFSLEIRYITFASEVSLDDVMALHGMKNMNTDIAEDPEEFTLEHTKISGREALKAYRAQAKDLPSRAGYVLQRAVEAVNDTKYGMFEQITVIRDTPQKVWIIHASSGNEAAYPLIDKVMASIRIEK